MPLAACTVDPNGRKLLLQAGGSLQGLGAQRGASMLLRLLGCHGIGKSEAEYFLNRMIEAYDYCIGVQRADYHGINQPKRDCHYKGIRQLIEEGCHQEALYPILDWMWLAESRITQDTGVQDGGHPAKTSCLPDWD